MHVGDGGNEVEQMKRFLTGMDSVQHAIDIAPRQIKIIRGIREYEKVKKFYIVRYGKTQSGKPLYALSIHKGPTALIELDVEGHVTGAFPDNAKWYDS